MIFGSIEFCSMLPFLCYVDTFYVGHQGDFDRAVYRCLKQLRQRYPEIHICVVLAYLPTEKNRYDDMEGTIAKIAQVLCIAYAVVRQYSIFAGAFYSAVC